MTRVALVALEPPREGPGISTSYAVRRVMAELERDPLAGVELRLFDVAVGDLAEATDALIDFSPDLVGGSAYVWSFPQLLDLARELKRCKAETTVVLGGPSARAEMFRIDRYRPLAPSVDAMVVGDGERAFRRIVELDARTAAELSSVPGVTVREPGAWTRPVPAPLEDLDSLASPYELGLIPQSEVALFETFRGCPMGCLFCQWGSFPGRSQAFSAPAIARDLRCIAELAPGRVQLIDAAINLNAAAFRNLVEAQNEVRVLDRIPLSFEVYPSRMSSEVLGFLEQIRLGTVGIGVQSYERDVLRQLNRRHDRLRVEHVVRTLAAMGGSVWVELIFGLPGDSPDTFRRTLDRVRELPCDVRVFHCLALPDALMTRAPPGSDISFDAESLRVTSCAGWSAADIERTMAYLDANATARPDTPFATWSFERAGLPQQLIDRATAMTAAATGGRWQVTGVKAESEHLLVTALVTGVELGVEVRAHDPKRPSFVRAAGLDLSYRGSPPAETLHTLASDAARLAPGFALLVGARVQRV